MQYRWPSNAISREALRLNRVAILADLKDSYCIASAKARLGAASDLRYHEVHGLTATQLDGSCVPDDQAGKKQEPQSLP